MIFNVDAKVRPSLATSIPSKIFCVTIIEISESKFLFYKLASIVYMSLLT